MRALIHFPQGVSLPFPCPSSPSLPPRLFVAHPLLPTRVPAWPPAHPQSRALLSGAGAGKAPLDPAVPRAPCAHPLHFTWTGPRGPSGDKWAANFSPGRTRGFALRNFRLREESFPPAAPHPGRAARGPATAAPGPQPCASHPQPARALPAAPAAPPSAWAVLCSRRSGAQLAPALGQTKPFLQPLQARRRPPQEERLLAGPRGLTSPPRLGAGGNGE